MIIIKSEKEIDLMRTSGRVTGRVLKELESFIRPGISTMDINRFVEDIITGNGMYPTFKGLYGFPAAACVSVNEVVVHGIPSKERILKEGDIVSVDVGSTYKGYVSDAARTYPVGKISDEANRLIEVTKDSFFEGLKFCRRGQRLSDISSAVQSRVETEGFGIIRDYTGHGVGRELHEDPQIPNFGKAGRGPRLAAGMKIGRAHV